MVKALFDTNILVDYLNGVLAAKAEMDNTADKAISIITVMEVLEGETSKTEGPVRQFLNSFQHLALDSKISEAAVQLRRQHKIKLPDAIILATAQVHGRLLVTRNTNDFAGDPPGVRVPYTLLSH